MPVLDPTVNPADLADPEQQRKTAENVLNQLGLHPNQTGARNLLDLHAQGPTAHPEIATAAAPLINAPTAPTNQPNQPITGQVRLPHEGFLNPTDLSDPNKLEDWEKPGNKIVSKPARIDDPSAMKGPDGKPINTPVSWKPAPGNDAGIPQPLAPPRPVNLGPGIQGTAVGNAPLPTGVTPVMPAPAAAASPSSPAAAASLITPNPPSFPTPSDADRMNNIFDTRLTQREDRLNDLIRSGSGISQIKNPFLRGLATVGDIAEGTLFPRAAELTPGTTAHHEQLIKGQEGLVDQATADAQRYAQTQKERQPDEFQLWRRQNPDRPVGDYWREKSVSDMGKRTAAEQLLHYYTTPVEQGGEGLTLAQAYEKMKKLDAETKPPTAASQENTFQKNLAKVFASGVMDYRVMEDPKALTDAVSNSPNLTPEEKSATLARIAAKTTPAAVAGAAEKRGEKIEKARIYAVYDKQTEMQDIASAYDIEQNPHRYVMVGPAAKAHTQEVTFQDMDFTVKAASDAMHDLKNGFDNIAKAQISYLMSSTRDDAWDNFLQSKIAQTLTPDQVDYVTALNVLRENILTLRGVQGMGQASDLMRGAMIRMVPGAGTPSPEFAERQLNIIRNILSNLKGGVLKSGIPLSPTPELPKTAPPGTIKPPVEKPPAPVVKPPEFIAPPKPQAGKPQAGKPQAIGGEPVKALTVPVGGTYNGFKYLGGDRTDQKNWQKVEGGK